MGTAYSGRGRKTWKKGGGSLLCGTVLSLLSQPWCSREEGQSPRILSFLSEAWKRELKKLTSRVAVFTKETELKNKEVGAEPGRSLGIEEADSVLCKEVPRSSSVGPTKRLSVRVRTGNAIAQVAWVHGYTTRYIMGWEVGVTTGYCVAVNWQR